MKPARLIEIADIPLDQIDCSNRLRPVTDKAVESLMVSIEALGLQAEIHIRRIKKSGALRLIAGGHRMEVFRRLERATIPAKVWDCTDDWAALAEIDDNLAHAELDTLELAVFLARRKEVYERAYPETKHGPAGAAARWNATDNLSVASFATSAADKMGVSERNVFRLLAAGSALGPNEINQLRHAPRKVTLADLQIIAKVGNPVDRYDICAALEAGTAKSAKEVMNRKKAPGAAKKDPIEKALRRLNDAFDRAPVKAQRRFVEERRGVLEILMDAGEAEPADVIPFKSSKRG